MTDVTHLERRFRRLLSWYPKAFRREHEDEMLVVLIFNPRSDPHYRQRPNRHDRKAPQPAGRPTAGHALRASGVASRN